MSIERPYYMARHIDGRYQCGWTTDGRDFFPIRTSVYEKPAQASAYCDMRNLHVSPLRASVEGSVSLPELSAESLRGDSSGLTA